MTIDEQQRSRLSELITALKLKQNTFAQSVSVSQPYINQIITGARAISSSLFQKIANAYPKVNMHWLMTGEGEMFLSVEERRSDVGPKGDPSMEDVEQLRIDVLERYKPDPPLSVQQDLTFRQACYKALLDNPGTSWALIVAVAKAYLQVIQGNPGIIIPTQGLPSLGAGKS